MTSVTCAPSAAYLAIVAPVPIDSSSGMRVHEQQPPAVRFGHVREPTDGPSGPELAGSAAVTDSFPRQSARTIGTSRLGAPRSFRDLPRRRHGRLPPLAQAGVRPGYLPVDARRGHRRRAADRRPGGPRRTRRRRTTRSRKRAGNGSGSGPAASSRYATDDAVRAGRVHPGRRRLRWPTWARGEVRKLPTATPAADPRPAPDGTFVAYVQQRRAAAGGARHRRGPGCSRIPAARRASPSAWRTSSRPRNWAGPAATGGRRTDRPS